MTRRIPLIRFKYGNRAKIQQELGLSAAAAITTTATATTSSTSTTAATTGTNASYFTSTESLVLSWNNLPARFRPRPVSEEEMEAVRFGGVGSDIMPIGWKPAPAKKGGKK